MLNRYLDIKEQYKKIYEFKFTAEDFTELKKLIKENEKILKDKNINYIEFDIKVNYIMQEWVDFYQKFAKMTKKW